MLDDRQTHWPDRLPFLAVGETQAAAVETRPAMLFSAPADQNA
jgi:hypothetical protein